MILTDQQEYKSADTDKYNSENSDPANDAAISRWFSRRFSSFSVADQYGIGDDGVDEQQNIDIYDRSDHLRHG